MAEPTEDDSELGHEIINDYIGGDGMLTPCGDRIAQALADAREAGVAEGLQSALDVVVELGAIAVSPSRTDELMKAATTIRALKGPK